MSRREGLSETLPGLRRIYIRLSPYIQPHKTLLGGSLLALLAATAMRLLEPWPLKFIFDRVVPVTSGESGTASQLAPMTLLTLCVGGLLAVVGLRALFQYLSTLGFALVGNRVLTDVRADLFRHLQSLSLGFHVRARAGDLTMRLIGDVGMLKETAVTAALPLLANVLIFAGMISVMLWLDWRLALLALSPLSLLWLLSLRLTRRIRTVSRKQRKRQGELAATSAETMAGIRSIQALGLEEQVSSEFAGANNKDMREGVEGKRLSAGLERSVDLLTGIGLAIVLWFGTLQVLSGRISPGDLLIFVSYLKHTFRPVRDYAKYTARLAKAAAAGERVVSILDEVPTVSDSAKAVEAPDFKGRIGFDQVSFHYGDRSSKTLDGVNLDIAAGSFIALTGPSGVGKSTLASLVLRLHDPIAGRIMVDGQDIRDFTLRSLRAQISLVPQEPLIIHGTIAENIVLGAGRSVTREEIEAAARLANAHDFILQQPEAYQTVVAERGATLSVGQRQRIAIARAAVRDSPIILLDEPTTGLDRHSEAAVSAAISKIARDRTTILVTHNLELAALAERILVLDRGRISEDGPPAQMMCLGG